MSFYIFLAYCCTKIGSLCARFLADLIFVCYGSVASIIVRAVDVMH